MNWTGVTDYKIQIQQNDICLKLEPELINIAIYDVELANFYYMLYYCYISRES